MITLEQIKQEAIKCNNPELAKMPGMVYQIWNDGEITCQKSGDLLWQRTLHMFDTGLNNTDFKWPTDMMPISDSPHPFSYAFVSRDDAYKIRGMMTEFLLYI